MIWTVTILESSNLYIMNPTFTIKLDQQILSGLATTGKCKPILY